MIAAGFPSSGPPSRRTLRVTLRSNSSGITLVAVQRVAMICPPSIGERPVAGKHGGFWIELRDAKGKVVFHRTLNSPLGDSVEVHTPDGKIRRVTGAPQGERTFDVLLPDVPEAHSVAVIGEPHTNAKTGSATSTTAARTRELANFDLKPHLTP